MMFVRPMSVGHDETMAARAEENEGGEAEKTFYNLLKNAMGNASAHGLPNIDRSESIPRKLFWTVLFIAGLSMFLWQCSLIIDNYFARNVDTSIELRYSKNLPFPAITICNLNSIKLSKLRDNDILNELLGSATTPSTDENQEYWTQTPQKFDASVATTSPLSQGNAVSGDFLQSETVKPSTLPSDPSGSNNDSNEGNNMRPVLDNSSSATIARGEVGVITQSQNTDKPFLSNSNIDGLSTQSQTTIGDSSSTNLLPGANEPPPNQALTQTPFAASVSELSEPTAITTGTTIVENSPALSTIQSYISTDLSLSTVQGTTFIETLSMSETMTTSSTSPAVNQESLPPGQLTSSRESIPTSAQHSTSTHQVTSAEQNSLTTPLEKGPGSGVTGNPGDSTPSGMGPGGGPPKRRRRRAGNIPTTAAQAQLPPESQQPAATQSSDTQAAADAQPVDAQPVDAQPVDAQQDDAQPVDAQPVDAQPVDAQPVQRYGDFSNLDFGKQNEKHTLRQEVLDAVSSIDYEDRQEFGHDIEEMLLSCSWAGYDCGPANFSYFNNYLYGNCYTFNSGLTDSIITSTRSGPLYGLELELYIEVEEYVSDIQEASGLRVAVHEQDNMPFPEDQGLSVPPGMLTAIGIRKIDIVRQPHPYGTSDCVDTSVTFKSNIFTDFFDVGYSLAACEKSCLFDTILATCGCADSRFRFDNTSEPCYSTNDTQVACQEDAQEKFTLDQLDCDCSSSCIQSSFEMTTSAASWPIRQAEDSIRSDLMEVSDTLSNKVSRDPDFVKNNVLKIQVYYEELNYEAIIETPAYDEFRVISDLGGQIGLWLGVSMITVFEFVELLFDFAKVLFYKIYKRRHRKRRATAPSCESLQMADKNQIKKTAPIERFDSGVFGGYYE